MVERNDCNIKWNGALDKYLRFQLIKVPFYLQSKHLVERLSRL